MKRVFLALTLACCAASCAKERYWRTEGQVLIVDNSSPLERAPVLRCVDAGSDEYRCEVVGQFGEDVLERGDFVRSQSARFYELNRRVIELTGRAIDAALVCAWQLDNTESMVLAFGEYHVLYAGRPIVWLMPEEYLQWMVSGEGDPPYPLEDADLEASIGRVLEHRCGGGFDVNLARSASGEYSGTAGDLKLRSDNGIYWTAEGACAAVDLQHASRRTVP